MADVNETIKQIKREQQHDRERETEESAWRLVMTHGLIRTEIGRDRKAFELGFRMGLALFEATQAKMPEQVEAVRED